MALVEALVHGDNRLHAGSGTAQGIGRQAACHRHLQVKDAGDNLQAVLDAVVDLLQQQLLLLGPPLELAVGALEFAPLIQIAQLLQLSEQPRAHLAPRRLRVVEQRPASSSSSRSISRASSSSSMSGWTKVQ